MPTVDTKESEDGSHDLSHHEFFFVLHSIALQSIGLQSTALQSIGLQSIGLQSIASIHVSLNCINRLIFLHVDISRPKIFIANFPAFILSMPYSLHKM